MEEKVEVGYIVDNLMDEDEPTRFRTIRELEEEPPLLKVYDENGNEFGLEITKELAENIAYDFEQIRKAYDGIPYYIEKDKTLKGKLKQIPKDIKKHPFIYGYLFAVLSLLAIFYSLQLF